MLQQAAVGQGVMLGRRKNDEIGKKCVGFFREKGIERVEDVRRENESLIPIPGGASCCGNSSRKLRLHR